MTDSASSPQTPAAERISLAPAERPHPARRWPLRVAVLAALIGGGVALKLTVLAPEPVAVNVVAVERGRVEATVTNSRAGTVMARVRARLSPEGSGRVVALPHGEGDLVEAGAVLLRLNDASQQASVQVARRALEATQALDGENQARLDRARSELNRVQKLTRQGVTTDDDLERVEAGLRVATAACATSAANVERARAELTLAEAELEKFTLLAPFAGVLADLDAEVGEWITPSPAVINVPGVIDLIDPSSIYVSAPMDEVDSAVIQTGQAVRVSIDPYPDQDFPGQVIRVAAYVLDVEEQNRTVEIEVALDDLELAAKLLPGTSADVEVILETRDDVLRIPRQALLEGRRVLVFAGGLLVEREVEVGLRNWDFAEIVGGLEPGEQVVTSLGREEVHAGAEAVLADDAP